MKCSGTDLTRWLHAAHAALAKNEIECVATSLQGRAEIRTPAGAIITAWSSGKISAGGPQVPRDAALSVLHSCELLVGYHPRATGGMLLQLPVPAVAPVETTTFRSPEEIEARALLNARIGRDNDPACSTPDLVRRVLSVVGWD